MTSTHHAMDDESAVHRSAVSSTTLAVSCTAPHISGATDTSPAAMGFTFSPVTIHVDTPPSDAIVIDSTSLPDTIDAAAASQITNAEHASSLVTATSASNLGLDAPVQTVMQQELQILLDHQIHIAHQIQTSKSPLRDMQKLSNEMMVLQQEVSRYLDFAYFPQWVREHQLARLKLEKLHLQASQHAHGGQGPPGLEIKALQPTPQPEEVGVDTHIQALPQELQDEIFQLTLRASLPKPITVTRVAPGEYILSPAQLIRHEQPKLHKLFNPITKNFESITLDPQPRPLRSIRTAARFSFKSLEAGRGPRWHGGAFSTAGNSIILVDSTYKPPMGLQINRKTRAQIAKLFYGNAVFLVLHHTRDAWFEDIPLEHGKMTKAFYAGPNSVLHGPPYTEVELLERRREYEATFTEYQASQESRKAVHNAW